MQQLRFAFGGHADIRRLQIAMNHQVLMSVRNSGADFPEKLEPLLRGKRALFAILVEALALDVFHGEERDAVCRQAASVKLRDVWVVEAGEEMLLPLEMADQFHRSHAAMDKLERDATVHFSIFREIYFAHSASSDE